MYGSVEQAFVGRDEPKNGCEGGYLLSCLDELTWVEPAIQSKTSTWSAVNLKKKKKKQLHPLLMSYSKWMRIFERWFNRFFLCSGVKKLICLFVSL